MIRKLVPIYSAAWRAAVVLLTVQVATSAVLRYVAAADPVPEPIAANAFAGPFLVPHAVAGVVALLVAPLQFVRAIRSRWPKFHRATGKVYLAACAVIAPTGFMLAIGTVAGPLALSGFAMAALLCGFYTWQGWRAAVERRFKDHRDWMLRSYAIIAGAITLRLLLPAAGMLGLGFFQAYPVIAWLSWSINLALFEYFIRRGRVSTPRRARLAPA